MLAEDVTFEQQDGTIVLQCAMADEVERVLEADNFHAPIVSVMQAAASNLSRGAIK